MEVGAFCWDLKVGEKASFVICTWGKRGGGRLASGEDGKMLVYTKSQRFFLSNITPISSTDKTYSNTAMI